MRTHVLGLLAAVSGVAGVYSASACELTPSPVSAESKRGITFQDLISLRDIGPPTVGNQRDPMFSVSPDRSKVAFQIRQASIETNSYCFGMFVLDLTGERRLMQVDAGGEFMDVSSSGWNFAELPPPGLPMTVTPRWSDDGKRIAYLRRQDGSTQVWVANVSENKGAQSTHLPFDIEELAWSPDDHSLIVRGRPGLSAAKAAITEEGQDGYRFDDRVMPSVTARPMVLEPVAMEYFTVDIASGRVTNASQAERDRLEGKDEQSGRLKGKRWSVTTVTGGEAWLASDDPDDISTPASLHLRNSGREWRCSSEACHDAVDGWFDERRQSFVFSTRSSQTGAQSFYRWEIGKAAPVLMRKTDALVSSCQPIDNGLLCAEEASDQPRRLVQLDLGSFASKVLFDPNPGFQNIELGSVTRLHWTNAYGIPTFGDLALPRQHRSGQKHALIVIGYQSRGFLRGGTGDEYPVFALTEAGYAVLVYQAPRSAGLVKGAKTWPEVSRLDRVDWLNFRSTASSLENGVDVAVKLGSIDASKVGITGLSFGASVAQFSLVNSHRYSAAVLSTCCEEASNATMLAGPGLSRSFHEAGYPRLTDESDAFWKPMSFRLNAGTMSTPMLLQVADREFLGTLESVTALREAGQPVDTYVFPDEAHIKWQPLHRLAVYSRSLQWFDFWLRGIEDVHPIDPKQYGRWRILKRTQETSGGSPGH